jgi:hypothetical protein
LADTALTRISRVADLAHTGIDASTEPALLANRAGYALTAVAAHASLANLTGRAGYVLAERIDAQPARVADIASGADELAAAARLHAYAAVTDIAHVWAKSGVRLIDISVAVVVDCVADFFARALVG